MQGNLNIFIIVSGGEGFPNGGAYINRIISLSKGLIINGNDVTIVVAYPGNKKPENYIGKYEGINYYYAVKDDRPSSAYEKVITGLKGIINTDNYLRKAHKEKRIDCILSGTSNVFHSLFLYIYSRLFNIVYIREKNEYPVVVLRKENYTCLYRRLYLKYFYKLFDGLLVINKELDFFFSDKIKKKAKKLLVPMLVEPERFSIPIEQTQKITFCGHLWGNKDGVLELIKAFGLISNEFPEFILQLIGPTENNPEEFTKLKSEISDLGLTERIHFTGFIKREKMPQYLCSSKLLVMARPDNLQAKGGFPTKLGEYFATGNPVVATAVGEIPNLIKNNVDAFLAEPNNVEDFAEKMRFVLNNPIIAKQVGKNGKKLATTTFNYRLQGERIAQFISCIQ